MCKDLENAYKTLTDTIVTPARLALPSQHFYSQQALDRLVFYLSRYYLSWISKMPTIGLYV